MDHIYHNCDDEQCRICPGGLLLCVVCGGAEASLPKDCPGVRMTGVEEDMVQDGTLNYINGEWHVKI
jgi:hypothetical protein